MADKSVAIRLGTTGKADVKNDFAEIAESGDASAKRLVASYDKAGDDIEKALQRRDAAAAKISALMPSSVQRTVDANNGTIAQGGYRDMGGGAGAGQNASAAQYAALLAQQEHQVESLRAALDPLYTAQKRYDDEVRTANSLQAQGVLKEGEHAAAIALAGRTFQAAKRDVEEHTGAMGLNRTQTIVAQSAVMRFTDSILAGQSPIRAFALEAHKAGEVLAFDDDGFAGGLAKVRALLTPTAIGVGVLAAATLVGVAAWYSYSSAVDKMSALSQGSGRLLGETGEQLEANAEAAAKAGDMTVSSARDIEAGYLGVAKSGDMLVKLTAITKDFAAATGTDVKTATQVLTGAFDDPIAGAQMLTEKYGFLTQAQADEIAKMVEAGNAVGAQEQLYADFAKSVDGAANHAEGLTGALHSLATEASNAFTWLGKLANQQAPGILFDLTGIPLPGVFDGTGPKPAAHDDAAALAARGRASALADQYTGASKLDSIRNTVGTLRAGIAAGGAPDQIAAWTTALDANEHALKTWIPAQQKANELADIDAKIAAAKKPAAKAALTAQREQIASQGEVITSADALAQAHAKADAAAAHATHSNGAHAASLARDAASMDASARAALDVGAAYLQSSSAGDIAEAKRKALTDATKKGIDADAQAQRQMALDVANAIVAGDKNTAQMRDETAAREKIVAAIGNHTISLDAMGDALGDQLALAGLNKAVLEAQPGQLDAATAALKAQTAALNDNHAAQEKIAGLQATHATDDSIIGMRDQAEFAGDRTGAGQIEIARRAAEREAAAKYSHLDENDPVRRGYVDDQVAQARTKQSTDNAKYLADAANTQTDNAEMSRTELGLVTATDAKRALIVNHLKEEQVLRARGIDLSSDQARQDLAGVDAQTKLDAVLKQSQSSVEELRSAGDKFIDDVFSPNGDKLKTLLADVRSELEKMALINPLKNLLLGENNPTIASLFSGGGGGGGGSGGVGSLLGKLKGLFGGGGAANSGIGSQIGGSFAPDQLAVPTLDLSSLLSHFAAGSDYTPGGVAWVGENGPEMVNLPQGSKVTNAGDTRRLMQPANDTGPREVHNHFTGNVMTPEFWGVIQSGDDHAAMRGTSGGRALSKQDSVKAGRRKLGTR